MSNLAPQLRAAIEVLEQLRADSTSVAGAGSAAGEVAGWEEAHRVLSLHRLLDAQTQSLQAGLVWVQEFESNPDMVYRDGRRMPVDRLFKATPDGRACLRLVEALLTAK